MKFTLVAVFLQTTSLTTTTSTSTTVLCTGITCTSQPPSTRSQLPVTVRFPVPDLETCRRLRSELAVASNLHVATCDAE